MKDYAITILEYGVQIGFSNAMVFSGYYGDGERTNVTYTFNVLQDIKHTANVELQEKHKNKNLKYEYKPNINILAGWLKNILIAMIFVNTKEERRKLYDIIIEKAEKNLVAIKPNRAYERKHDTSKRNKYTTNLRNNM